MCTRFMNSENSKTSYTYRLRLNITDKRDLRRGDNHMSLSKVSIYYTWINIKKLYKTINLKYQEQHGIKSLNCQMALFHINIHNYFECIIKKHETLTDKQPVQIYFSKIEDKFTFKIESAYYPQLLTPETMKQVESTEQKITKGKNGENVPHLENIEAVLFQCKIVNNKCQHDSCVLSAFVPNKPFGELLNITSINHIYTKILWFTDQNSKPKEIEDRINLTSVINDRL